MMATPDWAKPFVREPDEALFYHYVDIFSGNAWELDEFARQMLEVIAETKQSCTEIRQRMNRSIDKRRIVDTAAELRAERELYALYATRYSQYFGSLDSHSAPPASVVYRERRFFREIRSTSPPLPLEQPPPCPDAAATIEEESSHGNGQILTEIDSSSTICDAALELTANHVITDLIGEAQSTSASERRHRVQESTKRRSLLLQLSDGEESTHELEMQTEDEQNNNQTKHVVAEGPPEILRIENQLLTSSTPISTEPTADPEVSQSSETVEDEQDLSTDFDIVSEEEIAEIVEEICDQAVLSRTEELECVPLPEEATQHDVPTDPVAKSCLFSSQEFISETDAKTGNPDLLLGEEKSTSSMDASGDVLPQQNDEVSNPKKDEYTEEHQETEQDGSDAVMVEEHVHDSSIFDVSCQGELEVEDPPVSRELLLENRDEGEEATVLSHTAELGLCEVQYESTLTESISDVQEDPTVHDYADDGDTEQEQLSYSECHDLETQKTPDEQDYSIQSTYTIEKDESQETIADASTYLPSDHNEHSEETEVNEFTEEPTVEYVSDHKADSQNPSAEEDYSTRSTYSTEKDESQETIVDASIYVPSERTEESELSEFTKDTTVECVSEPTDVHRAEPSRDRDQSPLPESIPETPEHEEHYSVPPAYSYRTSISARPYSTAHFSYQTCSTTIIPCPVDEETRLITESSDVRTDPSYTMDVDEDFEEIGDDEFDRANNEVIYDSVPEEENAYDLPPTAPSQRSADEMRAEMPASPPTARPVSPMLTLGRQRQVELGVTLHEEDEIAYEEQEIEKQRKFQEVYPPPAIPEIAIDLAPDNAHLYDDDEEHIYEEIDDYGNNQKVCEAVYSDPPVPVDVNKAPLDASENHYEEPADSIPQFGEEHDYSVPDVQEDLKSGHYSELPYAVSGYYVHKSNEIEEQPRLSYSTSALNHRREVYYRNVYEDLDIPQSAGPTTNEGSDTQDRFPYYVEPDYTANAIRRMSRYNSWSQEALNNNLRYAKSLDHLNQNNVVSSAENLYHAEPTTPQSPATFPRSFPRHTESPQPAAEQKKTVYVSKPASRVTSSVQEWSVARPPLSPNGVVAHEQTSLALERSEAPLPPLPPPLDLRFTRRSQSNEHISYGYLASPGSKKLSPQSPTFVRIGVQTGTIGGASEVLKSPVEKQGPVFSVVKRPSSAVVTEPLKSEENNASPLPAVFSEVKLRSARPIPKKQFTVNDNEVTEDFRNSAVFKRISRNTASVLLEAEEKHESHSDVPVEEEEPIYKYEVVRTVRDTPVIHSPVRAEAVHCQEIDDTGISLVLNEEPIAQPRKFWKVQVNTTSSVPILTPKALKMPEIRDSTPTTNGLDANQFKEESAVCKNWNPAALINKLYEIDYMPRKESKRSRFINMEGHLDIPTNEKNRVSELEKDWKRQYFRTKDGRLQWFVTHCADEHPVGDVLLAGCDIDANREDGTLTIHGGRDHTKMVVKAPLSLFDKWRQALLSHAASSILDSYVQPIARPLPHMTDKIAIIELGSCSIRGGVLTMEPSLPQSFFPALGCVSENGSIVVGSDALKPEVRAGGQLVQPIPATDPAVERYNMNKPVVRECLQKVADDLQIDPKRYKVLLSLPQNIPTALIGDLMKSLLHDVNFQSVSVTRQPSLILYSYDVTTGVVVDIGERLNIVPVIDGYVVENAIVSLPYGAQQIRESLRSKLSDRNMGLYSFQSPVERLILRYVMEETCYVATDYDAEAKKCSQNENAADVDVSLKEFDTTPEMQSEFTIDSSRFVATEGLFKPKRWGLDSKALHELVNEAVQLSPIDSRRTLFRNIYLSGGTSLLPGLAERLEVELSALVPHTIHVQVHMSPWRYHAAYLGAQIVASSTQFDKSCVNKDSLGAFLVQLQSSAF